MARDNYTRPGFVSEVGKLDRTSRIRKERASKGALTPDNDTIQALAAQ